MLLVICDNTFSFLGGTVEITFLANDITYDLNYKKFSLLLSLTIKHSKGETTCVDGAKTFDSRQINF